VTKCLYKSYSRKSDFLGTLPFFQARNLKSKPCMDPAAAPVAPPRRGHPPGQQKDVTFCWPPVAPSPARLATPPSPSAAPARTLAAARLSSPPVPGAGTIFPHGQGFFECPDSGQEKRPSTPVAMPATAADQVRPVAQVWGVWGSGDALGLKYEPLTYFNH
jgi:hypothetical protein